MAGGLGFASARFYVSVRNLFTETDYTGYSPDVNSNGANNVDSGSLATSSEIGLGTDFYAYLAADLDLRDPGQVVTAMITPRRLAMRIRFALAVALVGSLAGCNPLLDESPVDAVPDDQAITTAEGARTALIGAYNALQLEPYYDRDFVISETC